MFLPQDNNVVFNQACFSRKVHLASTQSELLRLVAEGQYQLAPQVLQSVSVRPGRGRPVAR